MRSTWLAVALFMAGCFSESPSAGGCVDGEAACDCRPDATCDAGLECIASIDKCTPVGCTPGGESCTCVDGDCLSAFVCDEGVCIPPSAATTGGDVSMSGTTSPDTVADTTLGSSTTPVTMTDPATTDPTDASDPTIPPDDTSATDVTDPMSGTVSTDPTDSDATMVTDASASDTSMIEPCPQCIASAAASEACMSEYNMCFQNAECQLIYECIINEGSLIDCCPFDADGAITLWNELVQCAGNNQCANNCEQICLTL